MKKKEWNLGDINHKIEAIMLGLFNLKLHIAQVCS